ncbi:hypothetical protein AN958_11700 [Leucoagaricus sp. SymC.cos]|nr:hypothetical protein AN958_11700 [Leucoagaricus sp. SymC.cos]
MFPTLVFTTGVVLPLSLARAIYAITLQSPKVVLVIGASSGIDLQVTRLYAAMSDTTIITASSNLGKLRQSIQRLDPTPTKLECQQLDLRRRPNKIAERVKELDRTYGPITHLHTVSSISNHLESQKPWELEVTDDMINVSIIGTVATVLTIYKAIKERQQGGKICIVGSVAGFSSPANMISYASTKAFINTFAMDLRCIAAEYNIAVVTVVPGFIKTCMTDRMRSRQSSMPDFEFVSAKGMAKAMMKGVEQGEVGLVS